MQTTKDKPQEAGRKTIGRSVFVTGATGQQGGAVARALLKGGHKVRFLTRKPDSPSAKTLRMMGAEMRAGDFDDPISLRRAMAGTETLFLMGTPMEKGPDAETAQGKAVIEAAKAEGLRHIVYTSVAGANQNTGIPFFDSKHKVEKALAESGVPYTVIGPVFFMENYLSPWILPGLKKGALSMALPASKRLQHIAVADIGRFAALVIERRNSFLGRRIEIASDDFTGLQAAEILSRCLERKIAYQETSLDELQASNSGFALLFAWLKNVGYHINIERLRKEYPEVGWHRFSNWARKQSWAELKQPARVA